MSVLSSQEATCETLSASLTKGVKTCVQILAIGRDAGGRSAWCVSSRTRDGITTTETSCSDSEEYGNLVK